jgi:acetolactate synthase-1/2/3 large subunit
MVLGRAQPVPDRVIVRFADREGRATRLGGDMKTYIALSKALVDQGVDTLFGVIGDGNNRYIAAFQAEFGGRFIASVDERGSVSMADGFARATNGVGVATVSHGPALTNTLTALAEAVVARTPLVVLTADTPASQRSNRSQIDREGYVRPTGAAFRIARRPEDVVDAFGRAMQQAKLEQRPVVLDIPVDHLPKEVEYHPSRYHAPKLPATPPSSDALADTLDILASARNPVILAGRGAVLSQAKGALVRLADICQAALATTVPAKNLFAGHPLNLGISGALAHSVALDAINQSDVILAFGASLEDKTTNSGALLRGKTVIQFDNDQTRFNMYTPADLLVHGDAGASAHALAELLESTGTRSEDRHRDLAGQLADRRDADEFEDLGSPGKLDARFAAIHLNAVMPRDRAVVGDGGRYLQAAWRYLDPIDPTAQIMTNNFGSIGLGLPTAVGFAAGRPDLLTVAVVGDGGAMMGFKEFSTAVRHKLQLVVVVFNDEGYGSEYSKLVEFDLDPRYALSSWPRFCDLADASGGRGIRVESLDAIDALDAATWEADNLPLVIEVMMDPAINLYG